MSLTVVRLGHPLRCAACHEATDGLVDCPSCGTALHAGCRVELGACPTLGCRSPRSVVVVPGPVEPTDWPFLALMAWLAFLPFVWLLQLALHALSGPALGLELAARLLTAPVALVGPLSWVALGPVAVFASFFVPPRRACLVFGLLAGGIAPVCVLSLPALLRGLEGLLGA